MMSSQRFAQATVSVLKSFTRPYYTINTVIYHTVNLQLSVADRCWHVHASALSDCCSTEEAMMIIIIIVSGRGCYLVSHFNMVMELIDHSVVSMTLPVALSLFDGACDWRPAKAWKTCSASHLSQTRCISHCDTPQVLCNVCWSLGVISKKKSTWSIYDIAAVECELWCQKGECNVIIFSIGIH